MKTLTTCLFLCFATILLAQTKIFQNQISENNVNNQYKISENLASTYISTKYYSQSSFDLKSDLEIPLPNNKVIKTKYLKSFLYSNKSTSFVYSIANEPGSELVFSKYDDAITGMYASVYGEKIIFHQTDQNVFAVSLVSESELINRDSKNDFIFNESTINQKVNANICLESTTICPTTTIDVLVVFTPTASVAWGGISQSNSFIATAITNFNLSLINSGIPNITINLVYSGEIPYTESGDIDVDLTRFKNNNDGFMDSVHTLRTTYGADLCGLITSTPVNICGLGYLNTNPTNYSNTAAFTVSLFNCAVSNYTLSHEMGHNMGLNHDWYVNQSTAPCNNLHGYVNQTAVNLGTSSTSSQRWRTMMAYNDQCANVGINCPKANRWANPNVTYNSEPTGIAIGNQNPSDEAFGFARFACVVSQFMPTANLGTFEIKNKDVKDFTVFPNPAKDFINININDNDAYNFEIISMTGQSLKKSNKRNISVSDLSVGEYFLNIYDSKNTFLTSKKFIIK